ncbi:MAG: hypothetical protein NT053_01025 [Cyanobacteria bacterium]|nr:hypothetical protein [Cyanobacteriota bacterium]
MAPQPPNWRQPLRDAALSEAFLTSPEIVLATGLLNLFVGLKLPRGPLSLLLSHSLFCLSYAALTLKARLAGFDPTLELAAQDLAVPGLLAAGLLSFSLCFNDYVVSSFTAGETVNLVLLASVLLLAMASPPRVETRGNDRGDNQRHGPCSRSPAKPSRCTRTPRAPAP